MEKYVFNLIHKLKGKHKIVLLLPDKYNIDIPQVKIYNFLNPPKKISGPLITFLSLMFQTIRILTKEKIEVISTWIPSASSSIVHLISRSLHRKVLTNIRGVYEKESRLYLLFADLNLIFSDKIIINSRDFVERYIAQSFLPGNYLRGKEWVYIPNAINFNYWNAPDEEKIYDLVFVGYIHNPPRIINKGFDTLVKAVHIVQCREATNLNVLVIGEYDWPLIQKLENFNANNFKFVGHIKNRRQIMQYLKQSKIFVLSSRTEGMPNALMEALTLGCSCIATKVGAVQELIENEKTGVLIPPNDPESLALAIIKLIRDENYRRKLGQDGREFMKKSFSWEQTMRTIEYFYKKV
ncbi:MAG: hypothetical protein A2V66_15770 [Ignavibacteria bacterium RBG_13_36_8]|nr:MAG: hypothetical protein A2V66_15770 [Ignavibacteria bacterium RBG_13_36_8]